MGASLPKTSAARKNKSRWSSVRSVTAVSSFVSALACEGVGTFSGDSEWRFIMCALRWNEQGTSPTMTSTHSMLNTKSLASNVAAQERVGTVEHHSVAFDLHFDITTN
ncbi:hypothetical protein D3C72_1829730 [compost metagenome]